MENAINKPRILFYDIETTPLISYTWGIWEQDVIKIKQDWHVLSVAYKFKGDKKVKVLSLPMFGSYEKDRTNDKELMQNVWQLFNEADVVIGHNSDQFDNKKIMARFIKHGLPPPSPFKTVDTKKVAKRYFKFDSNKLNDLGKYLGLGEKLQTGGFDTWLGCMSGDDKAWAKMVKYNAQDVVLLEKVYDSMLPYMNNHPNFNVYQGTTHSCPNCGKDTLNRRGTAYTRTSSAQRYQCQSCRSWSLGNKIAR